MSDCPGFGYWANGDSVHGYVYAHCSGCAERDQLRAHLAQAEDALALARIVPEGACAICHQPFTERHEGAVMADDHGTHCHLSCWYQQKWLAVQAHLATCREGLREVLHAYKCAMRGHAHGALLGYLCGICARITMAERALADLDAKEQQP